MGHTKDCADIQKPNRRPAMQNAWTRVVTKEPALIVSQAAAPAVLYYIRSCEQPTSDVITSAEVQVGRNGIGLLDRPGIWYVYFVAPASTPVKEPFIIRPVKDPATALAFMQLNALAQAFDLIKWGGTALSGAQTGAEAGFASAVVGPTVNARLGAFRGNTTEFARLHCEKISDLTGEGHAAWYWLRAAAALIGRDTSDNTMRAIEARTHTGWAGTARNLYLAGAAAHMHGLDAQTNLNESLFCELPSNIVNGRAPSTFRGLWTQSVDCKRDADGTLITPTEMNRTVRTSTVNPAALAVVGVLDCRGLVHKDLRIDFTAADTARIQVSHDNTTWVTLEDIGGTPAAFAPTTALLLERLKAWRYVRVLAVAGFVGTAVVTINAMGA